MPMWTDVVQKWTRMDADPGPMSQLWTTHLLPTRTRWHRFWFIGIWRGYGDIYCNMRDENDQREAKL